MLLLIILSLQAIRAAALPQPFSIFGVHLWGHKAKHDSPPTQPPPQTKPDKNPSCVFPIGDKQFYQLPIRSYISTDRGTFVCSCTYEKEPSGRKVPAAACQVNDVTQTPCRDMPKGNYVYAPNSAFCLPPKSFENGLHGDTGYVPADCPSAQV